MGDRLQYIIRMQKQLNPLDKYPTMINNRDNPNSGQLY